MSLCSLAFVLFVAILWAAYFGIGHFVPRFQWVVLLVASLAFYVLADTSLAPSTLVYLLATAATTWAVPLVFARMDASCKAERGQTHDRTERKAIKGRWARRRRLVLLVGLAIPLGILAYLKYWNALLAALMLTGSPTSLGLVLPLGISFYTFQSVGYLIDAYNGAVEPQRNFAKHLLFVIYFPQVIQGPINRYADLGPQLLEAHDPSEVQASRALMLVGYGMVKKLVIANMLVDAIDKIASSVNGSTPGSLTVLMVLMYSAQQYGDFSGGIDMVEGVSELLGIRMAPNFKRPYFSTSLADFWRRWHISLGTWMRDYVFYPFALTRPMRALGKWAGAHLGEHAGRTLPACVANLLVFYLVGVWHGPELHFVAWGLYNGIVIALSDLLRPAFDALGERLRLNTESRGFHVFRVVRTFVVVNVGWYFDRIYSVSRSLGALGGTFTHFSLGSLPAALACLGIRPFLTIRYLIALVGIAMVLVVSLYEERGSDARSTIARWPLPARSLLYALVLALLTLTFMFDYGGGGFMYANY